MEIAENIASRLKSLRNEHSLTQQQVANAINVSRSAYSQYEMAIKQPTTETLLKLADFYHTTIDHLVGRY